MQAMSWSQMVEPEHLAEGVATNLEHIEVLLVTSQKANSRIGHFSQLQGKQKCTEWTLSFMGSSLMRWANRYC